MATSRYYIPQQSIQLTLKDVESYLAEVMPRVQAHDRLRFTLINVGNTLTISFLHSGSRESFQFSHGNAEWLYSAVHIMKAPRLKALLQYCATKEPEYVGLDCNVWEIP